MRRRGQPTTPASAATLEGAVLTPVLLLAAAGLVMIHSATAPLAVGTGPSPYFFRHAAALAVGAGLAFAVSRTPLGLWRRVALPAWGLGVVLLAATLAFGVEVNGAQRWLALPGLGARFQPVELAKLATLLAVTHLLARPDGQLPNSPSRLWAPALLALVPALLLVFQPDLGNAVLLLLLVALLLFVAGTPLRVFALPATLASLLLAAYVAAEPYAWRRLVGFLDPWERADAEGFQLVQSFVAFGRGGLFGVGLGDGRQKLFYLPEAHTDFMLAVVAEEVGLVGVLVVLGCFAALAVAGSRVARSARDRFALLLGFGATALLAVPALLNAAVVTGSIPTKGLPLPFLSYGRSCLLATAVAVGLLLAIARASGAAGPAGPSRPTTAGRSRR